MINKFNLKRGLLLIKWMILIANSVFAISAYANPAGIPISGFIEESANVPLVGTNVDFYISVLSPGGCVLYTEQHLAKNMSLMPGNFAFVVGEGTTPLNAYAGALPQAFDNFLKVFANDSPLLTGLSGSAAGECVATQYQPAAHDTRKIRLEFDVNDGLGRHLLSNYSVLKSVPYAHIAYSATKLGGKAATDFVQINPAVTGYQTRVDALVSDAANATLSQVVGGSYVAPTALAFAVAPTGCSAGLFAKGIAANGNLTCAAVSAGTVTSVGSANSDISVATSTSTPVLTLNSGAGASQILKLNASAQIPAVDGSLLTNLNPVNLSAAVAIAKGGTGATTQAGAANAVLPTQTANAGKVLTTDGTNVSWAASGGGGGGVTSVVGGAGLTGGTITTTGTLAVDSTTAGVSSKILSLDGSGVANMFGAGLKGTTSGVLSLQAAGVTTNYSLTFPAAQGASSQVLSNNGAGVLSWTTIAGPGDASYAAKGIVQGLTDAATSGLTIAAGVISVNSGTGANNILKLNASSQIPAVDGSLLTSLNPANLSVAVPLTKGGTGATTQAAAATAVLPSQTGNGGKYITTDGAGNISWATATATGGAAATVTGAFAGDVSGTQSAMVVQGIRGVNVVATAPISSQVLQYNGTNWAPATLAGSVTSVVGGAGLTGGTITTTGTLAVDSTTTGVASKILALDASGVANIKGAGLMGSVSGTLSLQAAATTTPYTLTFPAAQGGNTQFLTNNGAGVLSWTSPSAGAGDASYAAKGSVQGLTDAATSGLTIATGVISVNSGTAANQILKLNGTAQIPAVDGSLLTSLNPANLSAAVSAAKGGTGLTALGTANQVLGVNNAGTGAEYKTVTAGSGVSVTHGANSITIAATGSGGTVTGVTSANTDISVATGTSTPVLTLNSGTGASQILKLNASSQIPAVDGSLLTSLNPANLSAAVSLAKGGTGLTALGTANQVFGVNNAGTAGEYKTVTAGSGISVTHGANSITIASTGGSGTVTSVTGTAPISIATGTSTPVVSITAGTVTGQALRWSGTAWVANSLSMFDLRSTITGTATFGSGSTGCTSNQTLTWTAATDNLACTNISLPVGQITGTLPIANGGTGTTTGSITGSTALTLAAGGTNQDVNITPSGTGNTVISGQIMVNSTAAVSGAACTTGAVARDASGDLYLCK